MKKIGLFLVLAMLLAYQGFSQTKGAYFTKLGLGYTFNGKQNQGFEINVGTYYSISDYFYAGPKVSLTKLAEKKAFINIGPEFGTHLIATVAKLANDKENNINTKLSGHLGVYLGFNLDRQNDLRQSFLLNKTTLSVSLASPKIFNNHLYLGYDLSAYYHMDNLKSLTALGLGTNIY